MEDNLFRGLLPVIAALAGVTLGFLLNEWRDSQRDRVLKRRVASALLAEISALRERYWQAFGEYVSKLGPEEPLTHLGAVVRTQSFFSVYDGNTDKLGMFPRDDAKVIVRACTLVKSHAESLRQVADTLDKCENQIVLLASASHQGAHH